MRTAVERGEESEGRDLGFAFLCNAERRSWAVSCLKVPKGTIGRSLAKALEKDGFSIGSGYGKLKRDTIRIGHMGDHAVDEVVALLETLGALAGVQPE
jgi:aspartate aminotransferase-like enzyme